jgi:hypothetical protein
MDPYFISHLCVDDAPEPVLFLLPEKPCPVLIPLELLHLELENFHVVSAS